MTVKVKINIYVRGHLTENYCPETHTLTHTGPTALPGPVNWWPSSSGSKGDVIDDEYRGLQDAANRVSRR